MANLSNINNKFLVTTGGNVLIGQTTAIGSSIFQVSGEALFGNGTDGLLLSYSNGNSSGIIDTGHSSTALEFRVGNTQELLINGSSATFAGTVIGTIARFDTLNNSANSKNLIYRDSSGAKTIVGGGPTPDKIYILDGGNVGIGASLPASILHIKDNSAGPAQLSIQSNDFTRAEEINFLNPSTSAISGQIKYYTNPTVEYMSFSTSNNSAAVERLRITSNGSVYNGLASNTHFGLNALSSTTTADESTAFGNFALRAQQTGRNTAVGFHTLQDLSTGNYNTAVGGEAAENITTGDSNVAVGSFALRLGTTVSASTALGYQALYNATDSSNNTAVGAQASFTLTTGTQNTSLGWNALYTASTSTKNVAVGSQSMRYHTGTDNVAVGAYSMGSGNYGNGAYNVSLGAYAGYSLNTGASNTLIGNQAGYNVLNGANNIAIGQSAMYSQESVSANIAIGRNALYANVSGGNNTAIGDQALTSCTGSNNTAVGLYAGLNTTGNSNTFMGVQTFQLTTTGGSNVGMGLQAGYNNTVGIQNTYIGYAAGYGQTGNTGNANTAIGNYSQKDRAGGSGNTSVGHYALGSDVNAGFNASDNTAVGTFAGKFVTSGALNTFVGYNAGERITSGGNNTLLGRGAGTGTSPSGQLTSESNRVCLGNNSVSHLYCKISTITTSDKRDKTNFENIAYGLDFVNKLKPTAFEFKKDGLRDTKETDGVKRYGFLAQEILELEGENPVIINNDDKENLKYQESHLIPILVKAIQELKAEIELLKSK
jgi:hypothetical protein